MILSVINKMGEVDTQEDLAYNPFFKTLKQKFSSIYQQAEKNCFLICIPSAVSCSGLLITKDLIESHIFQPSPFFRGEFFSLNKRTVDIEDSLVITKTGYSEKKRVRILFEELFYNKQYKSFRVLCVENPLEGGKKIVVPSDRLKFPKTKSPSDCEAFLRSFPENIIVLSKIVDQAKEFNKTYVFVKGFEEHVVKKVESICSHGFEALLCANADFRMLYRSNSPRLVELNQIVECFILGILHKRLFEGLRTLNKEEDDLMYSRILQLQHISQADLGVRPELRCQAPDAVQELQRLDNCITPLEKIISLQEVSSKVTSAVASKLPIQSENSKGASAITTDDLIPLIAYVIIRAKLQCLITNLYYMENFSFSKISTSSLGFTLVTFRAAIEYLKSNHVDGENPFVKIIYQKKRDSFNSDTFSASYAVLPNTSTRLEDKAPLYNQHTQPNTFQLDSESEDQIANPNNTMDNRKGFLRKSNSFPSGGSGSIGNGLDQSTDSLNKRNIDLINNVPFKAPPDVISLDEPDDSEIGEFLLELTRESALH